MSDGSAEDAKQCKVFIGGLHLNTTTDTLKEYFSSWGEIVDAVVVTHPDTKRSRGFGFVTFSTADAVDKCLADKPHTIDDRGVEVKRAVPREESSPQAHNRTKKVFLGGLSLDTVEQDIRDVLETWGSVVDVQIMKDKNTEKPRGFGFAIFEDCDTVDKLYIKRHVRIKDRDVEVKKAIPQEEIRRTEYSRGSQRAYSNMREAYPRDPYAGGAAAYRAYGGGYDYSRQMPAGYDYRYPSEYMTGGAYMGGYGADRTAGYTYPGYGARGYDMSAYSGAMYGASAMGTYTQAASGYGPARDRDRGAGAGPTRGQGYHPYRR